MTTTDNIVIVGIARTPIGGLGGSLSALSAPDLGAAAIKAALSDAGVQASQVDEVFMGQVLTAGAGQAPARQAALKAGLPESVVCTTVNKVCGSGMKTLQMARQVLLAGDANIVVAGGMESMSNAPYLLDKARSGYRLGHAQMLDHMFLDGLTDAYANELMGQFAEVCVDKYQYSREQQDEFALESLARAQRAIDEGRFKREITSVSVADRKGSVEVNVDEQPGLARPEKIARLKPAFKPEGSVTAANSSSISDGAAALVLMTESLADELGVEVLARIVGMTQHAQAPEWFTTAPVGAIGKLFAQTQWNAETTDLFEINEAFACVAMAARDDLSITSEKLNINGGACALGHPIGASGARIVVSLLASLEAEQKKRGIAALCIGGGEAISIAIERK